MPMAKSLATFSAVVWFFLTGTATLAVEPFRMFRTTQGHSMEARFIGYQGSQIYIENQAGQRFALTYESLVLEDQKYCVEAAQAKRVPQVTPPAKAPTPSTQPPPGPTQPQPPPETVPPAQEKGEGPPLLRPGSFFSHKAAPLGEDPKAFAVESGGMPAPGEPIDFQSHVFPIIRSRCIECHGAPFVKNGRTINPKAGLRLDTYAMVVKGTLDGPVLKPGSTAESSLYELIALDEDDDDVMPPKGGKLTPAQIDVFKRWIEEGAKPAGGVATAAGGALPAPGQPVDFEKHLYPLLVDRCLDCHGEPYVKNGRTINPKAGLRLDGYQMVMKGTLDGPVVVPKNIVESSLYVLVNPEEADETDIMPPKGDPLAPEQVDAIKRWILEGALPKAAATAVDPNAVQTPAEQPVEVSGFGKPSPIDALANLAQSPQHVDWGRSY